jgi:uncharacterized protein involved in type VI secretion and phage assembly
MSGVQDHKGNGLIIGVVEDLNDPDRLGRVRVRFPTLDDQLSDWARLAAPMAGAGRGFFLCPEKGDEVLVGLEERDFRRPYIVGALWSTEDQPPANDGKPEENNWRFIQSRSGHIIKLDDTKGAELIEITDKSGQHTITIDSTSHKIVITSTTGDIELSAQAGTFKVEALKVDIKATAEMNLESSGPAKIKGAVVNIN